MTGRRRRRDGDARILAFCHAVLMVPLGVGAAVREDFGDEETTTLLARWSRWHDVRVALGLTAAAALGAGRR